VNTLCQIRPEVLRLIYYYELPNNHETHILFETHHCDVYLLNNKRSLKKLTHHSSPNMTHNKIFRKFTSKVSRVGQRFSRHFRKKDISAPPVTSPIPPVVSPEYEILRYQSARPAPSKDLLYQLAVNGNDNEHACQILRGYQNSNEWWSVLNTCSLNAAEGSNIIFMEELVALGADLGPNVKSSNCDTALHLAAKGGRRDMVKWLIAHGVDLWATNDDGETAKDCAESAGHKGCTISLRLAMPGERIGNDGWWDDIGNDIEDRLGAYDRPLPCGGSDPRPMRRKPFITAGPSRN
jgi:hypothetical protein